MLYFKIKSKRSTPPLDIDLTLESSGVTAIFGASGIGKSSFFNLIAGLSKEISSEIKVNGVEFQKGGIFLSIQKRKIGFVRQRPYLFPHLSIEDNLKYAVRRSEEKTLSIPYEEMLARFDVLHLVKQYPKVLSGGELQRVALLQALLSKPRLLLLDEAFSALDERQKYKVMDNLQYVLAIAPIPVLMISHSKEEIRYLADRVVIMRAGTINGSMPLMAFLKSELGCEKRAIALIKQKERFLLELDDGDFIRLDAHTLNKLFDTVYE